MKQLFPDGGICLYGPPDLCVWYDGGDDENTLEPVLVLDLDGAPSTLPYLFPVEEEKKKS